MENCVYAHGLQLLAVLLKAARICIIILVRAELDRIYENRSDDYITLFPGGTHQGEMSLMQCAHGRHQPDHLACLLGSLGKFGNFGNSTQNFHLYRLLAHNKTEK